MNEERHVGNVVDGWLPRLERLSAPSRDLAATTLAWCDRWWDADRGLPRVPDGAGYAGPGVPPGPLHLVPQSAWYAFGLLLRRGRGDDDVTRARRILRELLDLQYDAPGRPWHGGFARFAESPEPGEDAVEWRDYDPNWRQFLGTAFVAILHCFEPFLPPELVSSMEDALALTVRGEPPERVPASYSNIALLRAFLEVEVGARRDELAWTSRGEELAAAVAARFDRHGVFEEYNSPTYYGLDLFALGLWRSFSASPWLRREGARLEARLWEDIARWYHPGLRNLCGPFSRTYGMDMNSYVSLLGLWLWDALGAGAAPLPALAPDTRHGHDLFLGSLVAALGARPPEGARRALCGPVAPRRLRQTISDQPRRVASAWIGPDLMLGAESSDLDLSGWDQYTAVTLHWRHPDGSVAWLGVRAPGPSRAEAVERGLDIAWPEAGRDDPALIRIRAPGLRADHLEGERLVLPGLELALETDATRAETRLLSDGAVVSLRRPSAGTVCRIRLRAVDS